MPKESSVESLTSDYKIHKSITPWHLKNFQFTIRRVGKIVFENKNISLDDHSCTFDLCFVIDEAKADQYKSQLSKLSMKLHHTNGLQSKFLITVLLKSYNKYRSNFSEKREIDLTFKDEGVLEFSLPPLYKDYQRYLEAYVKDDVLTIEIQIEEFIEINKIEYKIPRIDKINVYKAELFTELYRKQELVDITFIVGHDKQLLRAHSLILAAACPYFLSMFSTSKMREQKTHEIDLSDDQDITFEIFQGFLDFVYGIREIEQMSQMSRELAILADKYTCCELCKACEDLLCNSLHKDNVLSLLIFAHRYNYKGLKGKSFKLIAECIPQLKDFCGFKELAEYPELMGELISVISK